MLSRRSCLMFKFVRFALICALAGWSTFAFALPDGSYQGNLYNYAFTLSNGLGDHVVLSSCSSNCGQVFITINTLTGGFYYDNAPDFVTASLSSNSGAFDFYQTGEGGGDDSLQVSETHWDHFRDGGFYNNKFYAALYFTADYNLGPAGAVPELSSWAMMLLGFGGLGALAYRNGRLKTIAQKRLVSGA